jgi:hypothetical protein
MLKAFQVRDFDELLAGLRKLEADLDNSMGYSSPYERVRPHLSEHASKAEELLDRAAKLCNSLDLKTAFKRAIYVGVLAKEEECTLGDLHARIRDLRELIEDELSGNKFLFLSPISEQYFEKAELFGEDVERAFLLSKHDLKEAGNCYALELYTACVFHLMRVLERGLRALAEDVGVPCGHECWGDIIKDIEDKLAEPDRTAKTPEKEERKKFCAEAATQFRYFKNAWRNYVMHDWDYYQKNDAEKIMEHVRDFMRHLAARLSYPKL